MVKNSQMRLAFFILILALHSTAMAQQMRGRILNGQTNKPFLFGNLVLNHDTDKQYTMADAEGYFSFTNPNTIGAVSITFSAPGNRDTTFNNIEIKNDAVVTLVYYNYCKYDAAAKNKTCPACGKKKTVIPILYGLPVSMNGEDPLKKDGIDYFLAGCEITGCDPNWYCKKDKTRF